MYLQLHKLSLDQCIHGQPSCALNVQHFAADRQSPSDMSPVMQEVKARDELTQGCWGHAFEIKQDAGQNGVHHLLVIAVQNGEGVQHICQCLHQIQGSDVEGHVVNS